MNGYFNEAQNQELRIRYVAVTHRHNDYVSGICEFAPRAQVELLSGARAELGYATRRLNDGERFEMGEVVFEVLHTPSHTPEHIGFLLVDRSRGETLCVFFRAALCSSVMWRDRICLATRRNPTARSRA